MDDSTNDLAESNSVFLERWETRDWGAEAAFSITRSPIVSETERQGNQPAAGPILSEETHAGLGTISLVAPPPLQAQDRRGDHEPPQIGWFQRRSLVDGTILSTGLPMPSTPPPSWTVRPAPGPDRHNSFNGAIEIRLEFLLLVGAAALVLNVTLQATICVLLSTIEQLK